MVEYLDQRLAGYRVVEFKQLLKQYIPQETVQHLVGATFLRTYRKAKYMIIHTTQGILLCHHRFTGYWDFKEDPWTFDYLEYGRGKMKDVRVVVQIEKDGVQRTLQYHDARTLAVLKFFPGLSIDPKGIKELQNMGPDVIQTTTTHPSFKDQKWSIQQFISDMQSTGQQIKLALLDQHRQAGVGNIYACLDPRSRVHMADGSKKHPTKIVPGECVWSFNASTRLMESKRVLNVWKRERNRRKLFKITPVFTNGSLKCTEDHRILTNVGWIEAKDLVEGVHKIAVPSKIPNEHAEQLVLGTSLGDSCLTQNPYNRTKSVALRFYQGVKQLEYMNFKFASLNPTVRTPPKEMRRDLVKHPHKGLVYQCTTRYLPYFGTIWEFSKGNTKRITKEFLTLMTLEAFAYLYLDDGSYSKGENRQGSCLINMQGRSVEEAWLVVARLADLGIHAVVNENNDGPTVQFTEIGKPTFLKAISHLVMPSMRYKLKEFDDGVYKPNVCEWKDGLVFVPFSKEEYEFKIRHVYDLEVEDNHNLIASNVVVHNCEALFDARIDPFTPANQLTSQQLEDLHAAVLVTLASAITNKVEYGKYIKIFRAKNCPRCAIPVTRSVQANRGSYHCQKCQIPFASTASTPALSTARIPPSSSVPTVQ